MGIMRLGGQNPTPLPISAYRAAQLPSGILPGVGYFRTADGLVIPRIRGGAPGAIDSGDLLTTADGVTLDIIWSDLQDSLEYYSQTRGDLQAMLTFNTRQSGWKTASMGQMRWERATEYARPNRQRARPSYLSRGLPVWDYELGLMFTRKFLLRASTQEIDNQHNEAMRSDDENIVNEILRAFMSDTNYTFEDDETGTVLTVLSFYNGDSEVPPPLRGKTFTAPHTHFHATNGAFVYADLLTMKTDLIEHGHDGNRVLLIASNLESTIRGMVDGAGAKVFVPNWAYENPYIQLAAADTQRTAVGLGPEYFAAGEGFRVRIMQQLPDNYAVGFNSYGDNSPLNPLAFRERRNDAEVGLQLLNEDGSGTFPIVNSFYMRSFGVAALVRSNATVMFVDAGTTYVNPTAGFESAT
jgi:hypothetical protein